MSEHQQDAEWNVAEWHGKMLIDRDGEKIGRLQDVYVDVENDEPQFATVKEGFIGRHLTFVPLGGITVGPDDLQVAVTKEQVKSAPNIEQHGEELSQPTSRRSTTTTSSTTPRRTPRAAADSLAGDARGSTQRDRPSRAPGVSGRPPSEAEGTSRWGAVPAALLVIEALAACDRHSCAPVWPRTASVHVRVLLCAWPGLRAALGSVLGGFRSRLGVCRRGQRQVSRPRRTARSAQCRTTSRRLPGSAAPGRRSGARP
jgi:hypothetical protein